MKVRVRAGNSMDFAAKDEMGRDGRTGEVVLNHEEGHKMKRR